MRRFLLPILFWCACTIAKAQTGKAIADTLKLINKRVTMSGGVSGNLPVISNGAMNVFLADKLGYLSQANQLSFYTNYVTLSTADGELTINHNFQKATGTDEPAKQLFNIGISANISSIAVPFSDKHYDDELNLLLSYKWISKVKTGFKKGYSGQSSYPKKNNMDALRAGIVYTLENEILEKEKAFKNASGKVTAGDVPGQNTDTAQSILQQQFYTNLQLEYAGKFAALQAETLTQTKNFDLITMGWTGVTITLPIVFPKYTIAPAFNERLFHKHPYPVALAITHTRLWESATAGRLFITGGFTIGYNNAKLGYGLIKTDVTEYKMQGGTDTFSLAGLNNPKIYIGNYAAFVSTSFNAGLVYFPGTSHVGISFSATQSLGRNALLNGKIGIPVVLINSKKTPAANVEFQVLFFDLGDRVAAIKNYGTKVAVAITAGIPLSRLMY